MAGYSAYPLIELPADEQALIEGVLAAESFRDTCWDTYGPDWTEHIPRAVNAFANYYFGTVLPTYVLALYYAPQQDATVHGGIGSAKTVSVALAMAIYHALHPGEPWLHVSPVKDQAARTFEAIRTWGTKPLGHPNFFDRFVGDSVMSPFPEIRLRPWNAHDPGNIFRFRPLGDDVELLRSMEAGTITVDEAFRSVPDPDIYPLLRGRLRGINQVRKAILSPAVRAEIDNLQQELAVEAIPRRKRSLERRLEALYVKYKLLRRNFFCLYGNVAGWDWEWERYGLGETDPEHYFSMTVTTYDNPFLDRRSIAAMERTYGSNKGLQQTEMLALRPLNVGGVFVSLPDNIDARALPDAWKAMENGGAIVEAQAPYGVFHYELWPDPSHFYVVGADPGSGVAPGRNKWVILVYDLAARPVKLVYFRMGHTNPRAKGDITAFWDELKRISVRYPHYPGDVWIESTANQKGQAQLAMPEDVGVTPVSLVATKPALINQLRMLLDRHIFSVPAIPCFLHEHGNYEVPDTDLTQDIVMANIMCAGALWRYIDLDYDLRNMGAPDANHELSTIEGGGSRYGRAAGAGQRRLSAVVAPVLRGQQPSVWRTSDLATERITLERAD